MKYIRINISTKQGNVVYQYDFDPYQTLQKVAQKFVDTQVLNGTIQPYESFDIVIVAHPTYPKNISPSILQQQYDGSRPLTLICDKSAVSGQPVKFFTIGIYSKEHKALYYRKFPVEQVLSSLFRYIEQKLVGQRELQPDQTYYRSVYICDNDLANLTNLMDEPASLPAYSPVELVPSEEITPTFTTKSLNSYAIQGANGSPSSDSSLVILVASRALEEMQAIARARVQVEQGGTLVGHVYEQEDAPGYIVEITNHIYAQKAQGTHIELRYTFEAWQQQTQLLKEEFTGKRVVGWYHTHLLKQLYFDQEKKQYYSTELFFSPEDLFIHSHFFREKWYVALVLNPDGEAAFFCWLESTIVRTPGFFII